MHCAHIKRVLGALSTVLCLMLITVEPLQAQASKKGDDWLQGAADDAQRFKRLESNLRGLLPVSVETQP